MRRWDITANKQNEKNINNGIVSNVFSFCKHDNCKCSAKNQNS